MRRVPVVVLLLLAAGLAAALTIRSAFPRIDADFATSAHVRYHYGDRVVDLDVVDSGDLNALKGILRGRAYSDSPSCGFTTDVSITLANGPQSITFCPACDGDPILRLGHTGKYIRISEQQRELLDRILARYGVVFPCV